MEARVEKIKAVRGFTPTTYAVYFGEMVLKIFVSRQEAENFANKHNKLSENLTEG